MRKSLFRINLLAALLPVLLAAAPPAPVAPPASQPAKPPLPAHVEISEIATSAESATVEIRGIESGMAADPIVPYVSSNLPALSDEIDARLIESSNLLQASPSLDTLRTLEEDWQTLHTQLETWKKELDERRTWARAKANDLHYGISLWKGTQQMSTTETVSTNDAQRIEDTIGNLTDTLYDVRARLKLIHDLYSQTDEQEARAGDFLDELGDARAQAYNRLLERDASPIWASAKKQESTPTEQTGPQHSFKTQLSGVEAYVRRNGGRFFPHLLLLVFLTGILFWLRRRVEQRVSDNPQLAAAAPVFRAPFSTALVLWFMVGIWIYPHAPRMFWAIAGALALIPTVVLLRGLLDRRLLPLLTALVVFYFVDQVRVVLAAQPGVSRWVFLGEMVFALVAVLLLLRANRNSDAPIRSTWVGRIMHAATWGAVVILSAAVLGDVVGYVSLASLLGDAVMRSAYLGLILYGVVRIVSALMVLAVNSRPLVLLRVIREHCELFLVRGERLLQWVVLALWGLMVLQLFWVREQVFTYAREVLNRPVGFGELTVSPRELIQFGLIIWASFLVSRFIRFVLEEDVYGRFALPTGIPYAISKMLNYVVLLAGFFMALAALGFHLTNFAILASAFTVGIGFGLQNIVNNFVSGIILLFERPVKVGDVVQLDDAAGVVGQIGIRASVIRTTGGAEVIVPNAMFISSRVTNWTLSNSQRGIEIDVNVAVGPRPQDVIDLLTRVASAHPLVSDSPRPVGMLAKFTVDTYSYELHCWTERVESWMSIRSDLTVALSDAFAKANISAK